MNTEKYIPNTITILNLTCGVLGIIASLRGYWHFAFYLMLAAAVFDFLDGMSARLLGAYSEIGKQLDSLADMVSFGILPGIIMFELLENSYDHPMYRTWFVFSSSIFAFLIPAFSGLRLAKFNIDTRQTNSFIGLPTPANALFIGAYSIVLHAIFNCHCMLANRILGSWITLAFISVLFSALLVSEIPLFSLKFKNLKWKDNKVRFIFLLFSALTIISIYLILFLLNMSRPETNQLPYPAYYAYGAIPIIIILYILISIFSNLFAPKNQLPEDN